MVENRATSTETFLKGLGMKINFCPLVYISPYLQLSNEFYVILQLSYCWWCCCSNYGNYIEILLRFILSLIAQSDKNLTAFSLKA